jgi:4-hydroxybenzoate polyprenyltransferase
MPSFWILAFSMFLFLSLASAKRYIELAEMQRRAKTTMAGRGYVISDLPLVLVQGAASGQIAVLIFALYINDSTGSQHFNRPIVLWAIAPLLLYWICRLWMKVVRAEVHDDPLVFALRDWQSQVVGLMCVVLLGAAL